MSARWLAVVVLVAACGIDESRGDSSAVRRDGLDSVTSFGSNPGNLKLYRYVPAGLPRGRPAVVLLHGCTQSANDFSTFWSSWSRLADALQFALVFPEQQLSNNTNLCFNWFESGDLSRDQGELLSIRQMMTQTTTDLGSGDWYVAGFSAGAATTINLLATYPDVFRAGASAAGVPYRCGVGVSEAFSCMNGFAGQSAATWDMRGRLGFPGFTASYPRVAIWQGLSDLTVAPSNRIELVEQWTSLHGIDAMADATSTITSGGNRSQFTATGSATVLVELNEIAQFGHNVRLAWADDMVAFFGITAPVPVVDAGAGGGAGGGSAGGSGGGGEATGGGAAVGGGSEAMGGGMAALGGGSEAVGGGSSAPVDAGVGGGSGTTQPPEPADCSCSSSPAGALLLLSVAWRRRRKS